MKKGYKECPFCKNEIKKDAIKCMYCKEMLSEGKNEKMKLSFFQKNKIIISIIAGIIAIFLLIMLVFGGKFKSNNGENNLSANACSAYFNNDLESVKNTYNIENDMYEQRLETDSYTIQYSKKLDSCISSYFVGTYVKNNVNTSDPMDTLLNISNHIFFEFIINNYTSGKSKIFSCKCKGDLLSYECEDCKAKRGNEIHKLISQDK